MFYSELIWTFEGLKKLSLCREAIEWRIVSEGRLERKDNTAMKKLKIIRRFSPTRSWPLPPSSLRDPKVILFTSYDLSFFGWQRNIGVIYEHPCSWNIKIVHPSPSSFFSLLYHFHKLFSISLLNCEQIEKRFITFFNLLSLYFGRIKLWKKKCQNGFLYVEL